ncbi:glycine zipper 2TM domain-containing protein [Actimicrobium sp. CCI2.3]|uniref:glycine zipper 2TM domain-containing protein n=1 Tax=Actimicrobium sp. CCI2.3 TaxID=3048616 RepID=UPI002AB53C4B|nr:glycine zipper 2TM domain-containing protein [Actimicrobium sp. CCI2.3]MDY7575881.1 glycine zipper 2TM domain-containing protein [Actimicrobium sp. CCI2.3]MEB0021695.1 glycine zipper 2TM domain-containing protein [Actimicrobium sp. CCI2.3]
MKNTIALAATVLFASSMLAGCAAPYQQPYNSQNYSQPSSQGYNNQQGNNTQYGVIDSIQVSRAANSSGIGAGAVVGGLVGGLLGNQVGGGTGRAVATAAGVVGGAVVGNQVEQNRSAGREVYQVNVRLDSGQYEAITLDNVNDLRVGNRVRVENGRVYRY